MDVLKLILSIGLMGKFILLFLFGMSLISWYYIFLNLFRLRSFEARLAQCFEDVERLSYLKAPNLKALVRGDDELSGFINKLNEYMLRASEGGSLNMGELEELTKIEKEALTLRLASGLGYLATCASTAPFIGLFGTVWGIMKAFHDIGLKGSATLATVAPGIAEALVNTAMGLFVAIPASMAYNHFVLKRENLSKKLDILVQRLNFELTTGRKLL
ncbi:MAG: MotA/TolQ/ExbB proton channel family protein [Thermodesulfobacteriaceae bacterium]|jgi:biopolymer transport protein TolQ